MGTIHEFPLWRTQRPPADGAIEAQIVIFPGVRIEREDTSGTAAGFPDSPGTAPRTHTGGRS